MRAEKPLFALTCLLLAGLLVLPIWQTPHPGMADYPNHLARAHILVESELHAREHPHYVVRHAFIPNLALDIAVPLLVRLGLSTNDALRVFTAAALLLPLAGALALGFTLQRAVPWLVLLAFPMAYSRYFLWGFLNYFFAVGVALLAYGLWVRWRSAVLLALGGLLSLGSHLMGFGILALLVACHELPRWRRALPAAASLALCAAAYLAFADRGLPLTFAWREDAFTKVLNLASPFVAYTPLYGLTVGALTGVVLAWLHWTRRLALSPGWLAPVAVLLLLVIALPSMIMESHFVAARLLVVVPLVLLAFLTLRAGLHTKLALAAIAGVLTVVKVAEVSDVWSAWSVERDRYVQVLQAVPPQARLATAIFGDHRGPFPARHVAAYAVIERDAFIPNFFGFPFNGESVAFREEGRSLVPFWSKDHTIFRSDMQPPPWRGLCEHYDVLLVSGDPPDLPECAEPLAGDEGIALYRLR